MYFVYNLSWAEEEEEEDGDCDDEDDELFPDPSISRTDWTVWSKENEFDSNTE